jgi:nucleoside phosphorylase
MQLPVLPYRLVLSGLLALTIVACGDPDTETVTSGTGPQAAASRDGGIDVAIVTVIPEEYRALLAHMDRILPAPAASRQTNLFGWTHAELDRPGGRPPLRIVIALAGEAGTTSGALAVLQTARHWQPEHLLLVGVAGGMPEQTRRGDVVISEAVWGYEYGALEHAFQPRQDWLFRPDEALLRAAAALPAGWQEHIRVPAPEPDVAPRTIVGVTASGNKVIELLGSGYMQQVTTAFPGIDSVEMEGVGALAAAELLRELPDAPGVLMLRGISDIPAEPSRFGDKPDREKWKRYAADSVAAFTSALLRQGLPERVAQTHTGGGVDILFLSLADEAFAAVATRIGNHSPGASYVEGGLPSDRYGGTYRVAALRLPDSLDPDAIGVLLERWQPRYVVVCDLALGLAPLRPGDAAVARMVWPFSREGGGVLAHRDDAHRGSRALLAAIQILPEDWPSTPGDRPQLKLGALAASPQPLDRDERDTADAIRGLNGRTIAIDRESGLVARAVAIRQGQGASMGLLSIQGIHKVAGEPGTAPEVAADTAASLAVYAVRTAWPVAPLNR